MKLVQWSKRVLLKIGINFPGKFIILNDICKSGRYLKQQSNYATFDLRQEFYNYINIDILKNVSVDYLEFGVFKCTSIQDWMTINKHNNSNFIGFDSFGGLHNNLIKISEIKPMDFFLLMPNC